MTFPLCPALETSLLVERRRLIAASEAALRVIELAAWKGDDCVTF